MCVLGIESSASSTSKNCRQALARIRESDSGEKKHAARDHHWTEARKNGLIHTRMLDAICVEDVYHEFRFKQRKTAVLSDFEWIRAVHSRPEEMEASGVPILEPGKKPSLLYPDTDLIFFQYIG